MERSAYREFKRFVPRQLKVAVSEFLRELRLRDALGRVLALPPGRIPDRPSLMELSRAWGNEGYSADPEFLEESLRRVAAGPGTVLECGSGLSTVLMAIVGRATNTRIWSLEHSVGWFARVRSVLNRFRLRGTHLILSPLRSYGDFMWYEPPWSKLPHRFDLVICDGPPEETSGGRFGLVPLIRSRLSPGAVLLVDDPATETGGRVLTRWRDEFGAQILTRIGPFAAYAVLTFQPRTTPEPIQDLPLKTKA